MSEQEKAFWVWYKKIEAQRDLYNLRMAFDAGYDAGKAVGNG
jgi:hypothetical protein